DADALNQIAGIGPTSASAIVEWFAIPRNRALLEKFHVGGLNLRQEKAALAGDKFAGLSFVLTGTLPSMTREEASALIQSQGGTIKSSVSKATSYVVAGESAG